MELKKSVFNLKMLFSVLCAFLILMSPLFLENPWRQMKRLDVLYWITLPMATSGFTPFACVFPVIPHGLQFVDEYNSGYIKSLLPRAGRQNYIKNKLVSSALSGGCVTALAFAFVFLICAIGGCATSADSLSEFYAGTVWKPFALIWGGKLVLLMKLTLAFAHGMVWGLAALLVSCIYTSRYAALMIPFVVYQIAWHLLQGKAYNPVYLLRGDWAGYSFWFEPLLIQAAAVVVFSLITVICMRRKINEI